MLRSVPQSGMVPASEECIRVLYTGVFPPINTTTFCEYVHIFIYSAEDAVS